MGRIFEAQDPPKAIITRNGEESFRNKLKRDYIGDRENCT
jgi:hypothetical protein